MKTILLTLIIILFGSPSFLQAQYTQSGTANDEFLAWEETDNAEPTHTQQSPTLAVNKASDGLLTIWYENLVGNTATVSILDNQGRLIKSTEVEKRNSSGWLEMGVASLAAGLYIVQVKSGPYEAATKTFLR